MLSVILLYVGAGFVTLWGVAHLFPTRSVVRGFGDITIDNRRIITMEWIMEGILMIAVGSFVAVATAVDHQSPVAHATYVVALGVLAAMALVSLLTGFRIKFLPFRLCPVIFLVSAGLIAAGGVL